MNIAQLIHDRHCGFVKVVSVSNWGCPLSDILQRLGLAKNTEWLFEIDKDQAVEILEAILWKDLAYNSPLMARSQAKSYSEEFIKTFASQDSTLYTNGKWQNYHESSSFSFNPMTEATFDAGVLVVHKSLVTCLWIEDED